MIRRLQPGYKGGVGALHSNDNTKPKIRYCSRCEGYGVLSKLGSKILGVGESRPADYEHWIQCHNCGQVYAKHEVKIEPELEPIKELSDGKQAKSQVIETKKKRTGRGSNPRLKGNKWEIKDSELVNELKDGSVLLSYTSTDPTEPAV
jgi:hypothetical protein